TLEGYEAMYRLRKGQIEGIAKGDVLTQNRVIAQVFGLVAEASVDRTLSSSDSFCNTTAMPPGAPPRMKRGRRYSVPGQYGRMRSTGLVVRSCSDWCPEPVTQLDLDTCRHHPLSPASWGKSRTQGSLFCSGYPASPLGIHGGARWMWCLRGARAWMSIRRVSLLVGWSLIRLAARPKGSWNYGRLEH